ncbi:MAG: hypothetical protein HC854_12670 [Flavobacterium sp.]|nr:hypothetical protein [Flavobacterium sp.]
MNDVFVDDNANVFTLGKLFISRKSQKNNGEAKYKFLLYKLTKDKIQDTEIGLSNDNQVLSLIINNHENKINLIGFYSEKFAGSIKGGCNFEIDANDLSVLSLKNNELPKNVYDDLYSDAKAERLNNEKKELSSFYVDYVIRDNDGNTILLAEEFYVTQTYVSTGLNGAGYWVNTNHYDDILILKI